MLQAIREHAQGWIAWVIVGLIIVTFALFGIDQYAKSEKTVIVSTVNGEEITANQFLNLYNRQKTRLQKQFGELYDQVVKDSELREEVLQSLIQSEVIRQWAASHNMTISDQQLASVIHNAKVFQKNGVFDEATYKALLLRNGLSPARFEYEQRQALLENQVNQLVQSGVITTPQQLKYLTALQLQERKFNFLTLSEKYLEKQVKVSDEDVQAYYDSHQAEFMTPKKVVLDYVLLSQKDLAKTIKVSQEALKAFYNDNLDTFTLPEKRQASHILIRVDAKTPAGEAAGLAKIKKIQAELKAGASFSDLAKKYSQDPGSAKVGGDLGLFQQGMMVPAFDNAVFGLKVGEVSGIVKTDFGYHLIKLTKILPKVVQPFDKVKALVESQYRQVQAEKEYFTALDKMGSLAYEQPDSLEPAAAVMGLKIQTTQPFTQTGDGDTITRNPKVLNAAFSDDVLKNHLNSSPIELASGSAMIVRLNRVIPASEKTFAEVTEAIKNKLKYQAAVKLAAIQAEEILAKVKSGKMLQDFESKGVQWSVVGWVGRDNRDVQPGITKALFEMPKPLAGKMTYKKVTLPSGDIAVLALSGVRASDKKLTALQRQQFKSTLEKIFASTESEGLMKHLVENAKVERFKVYKTIK